MDGRMDRETCQLKYYLRFKYWVCHLHTQHSLKAECNNVKKEMLWESSKNAKYRLRTVVVAGGKYIKDKYFFLTENIKGLWNQKILT